jgi:vacuolar-type H+-ATPase subunit H
LPKPKPQHKPATSATLLVTCDLACNWKLDGEAKGRIEAGGSAKTKVEPGQHLVVAATEDGADQVQQLSEVKSGEQTVVSIALQQVRDARDKAVQQARDKAAQLARDKAAQEAREKATLEAQSKAALDDAGKIWTDPETRLMWTKKDNGSDVSWQKAMNYCHNLRLAGHSDWRLPAIDELSDIYDPKVNVAGQMGSGSQATWHVKGNLQLSGWQWSNTQGNAPWQALLFLFANGERYSSPLLGSGLDRALCVRRSGQ